MGIQVWIQQGQPTNLRQDEKPFFFEVHYEDVYT